MIVLYHKAIVNPGGLEKIGVFIRKNREIAETYNSLLEDVKGVTLPPEMPWAKNVYWLYSILIDNSSYGINKDKLMEELAGNYVEIRRFFYPMHIMPPYKKFATNHRFSVAEKLSLTGINLPSSGKLTKKEICEVARVMSDFQRTSKRI